jgi:hypothetical protein
VDHPGQTRATRRPGSYSVSDSAGARRGIRTPDRLIKRFPLYETSRFAAVLRSGSPFDSTRTALQHHMTTVAKFGESPKQARATRRSTFRVLRRTQGRLMTFLHPTGEALGSARQAQGAFGERHRRVVPPIPACAPPRSGAGQVLMRSRGNKICTSIRLASSGGRGRLIGPDGEAVQRFSGRLR